MGLCPGSQVWARACNLVPIPEPEQPHSSPEDTRGVDGSLRATDTARRPPLVPSLRNSRPEIS